VWIDLGDDPEPFRRDIRAPLLGEADEKPLFRSETVNGRCIAAFFSSSFVHCRESDPDATVICGIFTEREAAIQWMSSTTTNCW
jgi:hypothetical protein